MSTTSAPGSQTVSRKLRTKDLIYAGAFGAIYIVLMLVIVMGLGAVPVLYLLSPLPVGLVCGTVYELCVLKVRRFGAALILGILFALVACSNSVISMAAALVVALLAELVIRLGRYQSRRMFLASFVVFNLNMSAPFLMLVVARDRFFETARVFYGESYASRLDALAPAPIWFAIAGLALVGGVGGALIASRLIRKHFDRAGTV